MELETRNSLKKYMYGLVNSALRLGRGVTVRDVESGVAERGAERVAVPAAAPAPAAAPPSTEEIA